MHEVWLAKGLPKNIRNLARNAVDILEEMAKSPTKELAEKLLSNITKIHDAGVDMGPDARQAMMGLLLYL